MRKIKLFPEEEYFALNTIEEKLNFTFLKSNIYQKKTDKTYILKKALEKEKKKLIPQDQLDLGYKHQKEIQECFLPKFSLRYINPIIQYGFFAEETIAKGSYVGEYTGIIKDSTFIYFEPLNDYCYQYPIKDKIGRNFVIDAAHGSFTRFINHSYSPNLAPYYAYLGGLYHLIFLAICEIKKGTQLSYNYGKNYWHLRGLPASLD